MMRAPHEPHVQDSHAEGRMKRSGTPRRRRTVSAIAAGAALALAQVASVADAAGHRVESADHAAFEAVYRDAHATTWVTASATPTVLRETVTVELSEPHAYNGNGHGNGGRGRGSHEGNGRGSKEGDASPAQQGSHGRSHNAANGSPPHQTSHHNTSGSPAKSAGDDTGARAAKTPQTEATDKPTVDDDNGLHLGQLFHQGINESQAEALLDAVGGGSGLTAEEVRSLSLGELLNTAHAAGLSTRELSDILEANASEGIEATP